MAFFYDFIQVTEAYSGPDRVSEMEVSMNFLSFFRLSEDFYN